MFMLTKSYQTFVNTPHSRNVDALYWGSETFLFSFPLPSILTRIIHAAMDDHNEVTLSSQNPLASDEKLQGLLTSGCDLSSEKDFVKWKKSFLKIYMSYLDPDGVLNAKDANDRLLKKLKELSKRCKKVKTLVDNHNIHPDQITAEGRRGLTNLSDELGIAEAAINEFMPKTSADEERVGYDKFELGAVLIQDGFHGYDLMVQSRDFLTEPNMKQQLSGVIDGSSFWQIFQRYSTAMDVFIQVMEDLGLFQIMKQCVTVVYKDKKRKEPKPSPAVEDVDKDEDDEVKTTNASTKKPKDTKKKGKKKKGSDDESLSISKGLSKNAGKKKSVRNVQEGTTGGREALAGGRVEQSVGEENPVTQNEEEEEEKEEQDGQGTEPEFLFYFDPKTNTLGMIDRAQCGANSKLLLDVEKEGKDAYQNLVEEENEKKELIWLLKKLERTRPVEVSWLEEIKKEKAPAKNKEAKNNNGSKMASGTGKQGSQPSVGSGSRSATRRGVASKNADGPGFRDPFSGVATTPSSGPKPMKKKTVENYQGKYRNVALKPEADGWKKIS